MSEGKTFYRCTLCTSVVNQWDIESGIGCPKCAGTKVQETNLSLWEKFVQICKHPKIWEW